MDHESGHKLLASPPRSPLTAGTASGSVQERRRLMPSWNSPRQEAAAVVVSYVLMMAMNIVSGATSLFNNTNNAKLSNANPTYVTPDGVTFSIWGIIYLAELAGCIYMWRNAEEQDVQLGSQWIVAAFLLNSLWLPLFAYELWWISLAVIAAYLYTLFEAARNINVDFGRSDSGSSLAAKLMLYLGISVNAGWVTVATLVNFTVVARNSRIITSAAENVVIGGNPDWAVLCIAVATVIAVYRAIRRCDAPYAAAIAWALAGVHRMQTVPQASRFPIAALSPQVASWATAGMAVAGVAAVAAAAQAIHKSRSTVPGAASK